MKFAQLVIGPAGSGKVSCRLAQAPVTGTTSDAPKMCSLPPSAVYLLRDDEAAL